MSRILLGHLKADRERWIEAAHKSPMGTGMLPYLVI
jgi:hypothetical protein